MPSTLHPRPAHGMTPTNGFLSLSNQVLEAKSGTALAKYAWGAGYLDNLVSRTSGSDGSYYAATDANSNVTGIYSYGGNVAERFLYSPYGKRTDLNSSFSTSADTKNWVIGWQGLRCDAATAMYHARNRWYSPSLMRWTTWDFIGYGDGMNPNLMEAGNPINRTDPSGLITIYVHGVRMDGSEWHDFRTNAAKSYTPRAGESSQYFIDMNWAYDGPGSTSSRNPAMRASDSVGDRGQAQDRKFAFGMSEQDWLAVDKLKFAVEFLTSLKMRYKCFKDEPINILAYSQGTVITTAFLQAAGPLTVNEVIYMGSPLDREIVEASSNNTLLVNAASHTDFIDNFYSSGDKVAGLKGGIGHFGLPASWAGKGYRVGDTAMNNVWHTGKAGDPFWYGGGWLTDPVNQKAAESPMRKVLYSTCCSCTGTDKIQVDKALEFLSKQMTLPIKR